MFGKVRSQKDQERSRRNERNIAQTLYIETYVARWINRCQEVTRIKNSQIELSSSYQEAIKRCPQQINFDGSRRIKHPETFSMDRVAVK